MKIFVYGTLLPKFSRGFILDAIEAKFVEDREIPGFCLYANDYYPIAVKDENSSIIGKVYEISEDKLKVLDKVEGYPYLFNRKLVGDVELYYMDEEKAKLLGVKTNFKSYKEIKNGR